MNSMLRHSLAATALLALASPALFAQQPAAPATGSALGGAAAPGAAKPLAPQDKKFILDSGKSLYFESQITETAKNGAKTDATKKFAEGANKDLYKAWTRLAELAKEKGENVAAELSGGDKGSFERLKKTKPDNGFDKLFFREFLKEAKGVERDFVSAAKSSPDPEIKQFATDYLPSIKNHVNDGEKAEKEAAKAK